SPGRDCVSAQMRRGPVQLADRPPARQPVPGPPDRPYRRRHHPWWSTEDPPQEHRSAPVRPTAERLAEPRAAPTVVPTGEARPGDAAEGDRPRVRAAALAGPSEHPPSRRPERTPVLLAQPELCLPTSGTRIHLLQQYRGSTLWRCRITQLRQQSL